MFFFSAVYLEDTFLAVWRHGWLRTKKGKVLEENTDPKKIFRLVQSDRFDILFFTSDSKPMSFKTFLSTTQFKVTLKKRQCYNNNVIQSDNQSVIGAAGVVVVGGWGWMFRCYSSTSVLLVIVSCISKWVSVVTNIFPF